MKHGLDCGDRVLITPRIVRGHPSSSTANYLNQRKPRGRSPLSGIATKRREFNRFVQVVVLEAMKKADFAKNGLAGSSRRRDHGARQASDP